MEIASKEAALSKEMNDADKGAIPVDPSGGDGMVVDKTRSGEEDVDRIGDVDQGGHVYKVNTDFTASDWKADHYNPETGTNEPIPSDYYGSGGPSSMLFRIWEEGEEVTPRGEFLMDVNKKPGVSDVVTVGSGQPIHHFLGTPEDPQKFYRVVPNSLFIDGVATQDDVRQGNLGDCYFLAAVLQVLHYDPSTITNMMSIKSNGDVYTELYHREGDDKSGYRWIRKPVVVKWGETMQANSMDAPGFAKGARFRLKYDPEKEAKWCVNFQDEGVLKCSKTQYYQAAMWVHCLEHAFAGFAQLYGQYGRGSEDRASKSDAVLGDSYRNIKAGNGGFCLFMFYGEDVESQYSNDDTNERLRESHINVYKSKDLSDENGLVDSSETLLNKLAILSQTQDGSQDKDMHICVGVSGNTIGRRVAFFADQVLKELQEPLKAEGNPANRSQLQKAETLLTEVAEKAEKYSHLRDSGGEGESSQDQEIIEERLHEIQISLKDITPFTNLNLPSYPTLKSTMATLIHMPGEDIYMYTKHAYNIREVHFVGKDGNPIDITTLYAKYINGVHEDEYNANLAESDSQNAENEEQEEKLSFWQKIFGKKNKKGKKDKNPTDEEPKIQIKLDLNKIKELVDLDKSTAVIQNPHARSKAVYPGEKESRTDTGTWTTTLRDLLANTGDFTAVTVRNHRHDGDKNGLEVTSIDGPEGEKSVETP